MQWQSTHLKGNKKLTGRTQSIIQNYELLKKYANKSAKIGQFVELFETNKSASHPFKN